MTNVKTQEKEDRRIYIMSKERPTKAVLSMGLPLIAGMMVMSVYNLVDTFFISLLHDDYQLAAVNLAYPVMMISIALSNMIGTGAASLIARSLGAGDKEKAEHTLTVGIGLMVLLSLMLSALGLFFLNPIVTLLGAKENTFTYTMQYVAVILGGSLFTMGSYTMGQLLRSEGSAKQSMAGMLSGTVANIVLDPVFIFGFHMGIRGAAIATILGNAIGTLLPCLYYVRKKTLLMPAIRYLKPTSEIVKEIFFVGVPAMLETGLTSMAYVVNNNLAVGYGELTVTAMGISQKIISFGSYIYQGFAAGNQPLMGYNYGAKNYRRMLDILKAGVLVVSSIELGMMVIFGVGAEFFIGIFSQTEEVVRIGSQVMRANMFILPFVGSVSMTRTTFQAMGKPLYSFGITVMRQLILYIPLLLILNHLFAFRGMIYAQPITECIMMIVSVGLLSGTLIRLNRAA